jgi:hypothetical protein
MLKPDREELMGEQPPALIALNPYEARTTPVTLGYSGKR